MSYYDNLELEMIVYNWSSFPMILSVHRSFVVVDTTKKGE